MQENLSKNTVIHISSKSHLNLTFNLLQCGGNEILPDGLLSISASDIFTLMYINSGEALLETNSLAFRAESNQGFFAFPDTRYDLKNIGGGTLEIVWLSFTGYMVENYLNRANIHRAKPLFSDSNKDLGERINRIFSASQQLPNRYCRMMSSLYDIFSRLLDANPTRSGERYVDNADFFAIKATDYIERSYAKDISVDEIAAAVGISRKHLYSVFNDILKIPPKQYLIYYRIEKACMRLKSTDQSVQEIAESVGYSNQFYFSKEFKRLTGMAPSEYRKFPNQSEIFSYRSFLSTLKEQLEDHSLDLPIEEQILSVHLPPQPVGARRAAPKGSNES